MPLTAIHPRDPVHENPAVDRASRTAADPYECAQDAVRDAIEKVTGALQGEDDATLVEAVQTLDAIVDDLGFYAVRAAERAANDFESNRADSYGDHLRGAAE